MAGKYAGIVDKLPRLVAGDASYQEKVEAVKKAILEEEGVEWMTGRRLAEAYAAVRAEVDAIEAQLSKANLRLEAVRQMAVNQFEVEDTTSITFPGANVRVQVEPYAQVKDKEAFRKWCINTCQICGVEKDKHGKVVQDALTGAIWQEGIPEGHTPHNPSTLETSLSLAWQSTNAITKERLLAGLPEPDGVEAFQKQTLVLKREKGAAA